ncbi:MAG TPA: MotA/TolQ/ExbB proton channel family protein [Nitrospirota bacterium]|nr:MotA/TolQ/ExbB proton channel family protein [Nitrospirota bacterium]
MDRRYFLTSIHLLTKIFVLAGGLAFFIGVLAVPDAHAWWDGKWQQRKKIQFDTSEKAADIKENLVDVTLLVRLHTGNFTFSGAKADGSDLRFVSSDDKTPLKFHIEKFDPSEEMALIWVKVPSVSASSAQNSIWMYYGNSSAPDGQDKGGTFDMNYVAVYHLAEKDGNPRDATAYANNVAGFTGKLGIPSVLGNGAQFDGTTGGQMTIARSPSLTFTKGFTFSSWVRMNQPSGSSQLFSWDDGIQSIVIGIDNGNAYCSLGYGKGPVTETPKTVALIPNHWQHLAVVVDSEKRITVYLDGKEASASVLNRAIPAPSSDIILGGAAKGGNAFIGDLDEVQLSNSVRTAGWIKAEFQSQGPDGVLTSYLEEETGGGGGESFTIHMMKVIMRTITLDGWLIIGVLVIMGFGSLYIFRQKVAMLNRAKKVNQTFSQSFRDLDHPFSLIDKEQHFHGSPIYRVYRAGCEELKSSSAGNKAKPFELGKGLPEKVMNGFKAAVEIEAMYESRKLSAGMVIMNMSVAGGPFLGLLGTVWGVMNTFAGLAESGEANLAAIAPGVASALSCTLAGLLVAIPSLFASSYVTSRIKDMNADVNVFIERFILMLEGEK